MMYQLGERNHNNTFKAPLIYQQTPNPIVPNQQRNCTDLCCLIFLTLFVCAFSGILTYGLIVGDPRNSFGVFNPNGIRCDTTSFKYGFFTTLGSFQTAACVSQCPSLGVPVSCLASPPSCPSSGSLNATYSTFSIDYYCLPDLQFNSFSVSEYFNSRLITAWAFELSSGWPILLGAFGAAVLASIIFLLLIRCCVTAMVWIFVVIAVIGFEGIGILFILQSQGIHVHSLVSSNLSTLSYNTLLITGIVLISVGVLFTLLTICLRSRIMIGSKAVEIGSIFLFENCYMILLPITQAIFIVSSLGATIVGAVYLYSLGTRTSTDAFSFLTLDVTTIILISILAAGGIWMVFFFQGCNRFLHCSAVAIWYFNQKQNVQQGSACCDSLTRLVRYHIGSVAITGLVNGVFFIIKIIAYIFTFQVKEQDTGIVVCCLKCLNYLFCIFNWMLRFLNDGTYVQIAVTSNGYCTSTIKSFDIAVQNASKLVITEGISFFFTLIGILAIGFGTAIAAYFVLMEVEYFAELATTPFIVVFVSASIAFTFSGLYLSMIDLSSTSVLQCVFIDNQNNNGKPRFARQRFQQILMTN